MLVKHQDANGAERAHYSLLIPTLQEAPSALGIDSQYFALLVSMDATSLTSKDLESFAARMLDAGCAYACCWGPDCQRVELAFDLVIVHRQIESGSPQPHVSTSSHRDEQIEEAIYFATQLAWPGDLELERNCRAVIAVVVANRGWYDQIKQGLDHPDWLWDAVDRLEAAE